MRIATYACSFPSPPLGMKNLKVEGNKHPTLPKGDNNFLYTESKKARQERERVSHSYHSVYVVIIACVLYRYLYNTPRIRLCPVLRFLIWIQKIYPDP